MEGKAIKIKKGQKGRRNLGGKKKKVFCRL